jgi:hypothetical protein
MPIPPEGVDDHDERMRMPDPFGALVKTPSCPQCLGAGHLVSGCPTPIRCLHCFNYGHIKKTCLQWKM